MADASFHCGICTSRQTSRPAVIWCQDCSEGICKNCREHHDLFKQTRGHKTIPINDYHQLPMDIQQITDICQKHDEKYVIYCQNHLQPCCRFCVLDNHKSCKDVAKLEDVTRDFKSSFALQDTETTLKECLENILKIKDDRYNNLKSVEAESSKALDEIEKVRRKINQHLDYLQDKIKVELKQIEEQTRKKIHDTLTAIDKLETFLNEQIQTFSKIRQYATDFQAFLFSCKWEEQIQAAQKRILELSKDESCSTSRIMIKLDNPIDRLTDQFTCLGSIEISSSPSSVVLSKKKETEAQIIAPRPLTKQIEEINLTVDKTIEIRSSNCFGCCILSDGRVAFTDYNDAIIRIFNINGPETISVQTPENPFDTAQIKDTTLAVSCFGSGIHLVDLNTMQSKKVLLEARGIDGVQVRDDNHLVYCEVGKGVRQIRISDGTVTDIVKEKLPCNCFVTSFGDTFIYTNNETNTVACHDIDGKNKWTFKDERILHEPRGVTVDNRGNVFVAGCGSRNIVVISADGQRYKEVKQFGLNSIYVLDYDKSNDTLLAVSYRERKAVLLKLN